MLSELKFLGGESDFVIDEQNSNRYRILTKGTKGCAAYYFSTPIYSIQTNELVRMNFEKYDNKYLFRGSNSVITVSDDKCIFENQDGKAVLIFNERIKIQETPNTETSPISVTPTVNGIKVVAKTKCLKMRLIVETECEEVRSGSTYLSVMKEKFKPFLSVATLFANNADGAVASVELEYQEDGLEYELDLCHELVDGELCFEVNLYEPKLFQDNVVTSAVPEQNNVYSAIAFLGSTEWYGETWLYSRLDFTKIPELLTERVGKILLHIPTLGATSKNIEAFVCTKRFCSFGSTWAKKPSAGKKISDSINAGKYITIDVTNAFNVQFNSKLVENEGLIIKKEKNMNEFVPIATGDCYFAPQILEIEFE